MKTQSRILKLTNCLLCTPTSLVEQDLYIDQTTGTILSGQDTFFDNQAAASRTIDLGGRIVAPGFIDVQINGCFGLDFSVPSPTYVQDLARVKKKLAKQGVTAFLPTLTSQLPSVYAATLSHLGADAQRVASAGCESLGAHLEGPFINTEQCGIHSKSVLQIPSSIVSLEKCYGAPNLRSPTVKMVTMAPELDASRTIIPELSRRGIVHSTGHSTATRANALDALSLGSTMITHLYNAMPQPHSRDTSIVGLLGATAEDSDTRRPFYGLIADGIHVHPSMVRIAYNAYPRGCCLVTDAMSVVGMPDGKYPWTNGEYIFKKGSLVTLERTGGVAGSGVHLLTCANNLRKWTGIDIPAAIETVTGTPALMLGLQGKKGCLTSGADADLVVLQEGKLGLEVEQVWKFGECILSREPLKERSRAKL